MPKALDPSVDIQAQLWALIRTTKGTANDPQRQMRYSRLLHGLQRYNIRTREELAQALSSLDHKRMPHLIGKSTDNFARWLFDIDAA